MAFDKKKRAAELSGLSNKELLKLGGPLGLKLSDKAAKRQLVGSILEAENKKFLEAAPPKTSIGEGDAGKTMTIDTSKADTQNLPNPNILHAGDLTPPGPTESDAKDAKLNAPISEEGGAGADTPSPAATPEAPAPKKCPTLHGRISDLNRKAKK